MLKHEISKLDTQLLWMRAQGLLQPESFGRGPNATPAAIEKLGYVQIDTINVIERCHHHILHSRIPDYKRAHLHQAQAVDKSVFEAWTHALAYAPTKDFPYFMAGMTSYKKTPNSWFGEIKTSEFKKVLKLIKETGPISIRDVKDDVLVEKNHPWASRKPTKRLLQYGFYSGELVVSERIGMLKKYEITSKHFAWTEKPKAANAAAQLNYRIDRALNSQAVISLESVCHLIPRLKPEIEKLLHARVKRGELVPLEIKTFGKKSYWARPAELDQTPEFSGEKVHILSPFDPLIIQRKRLKDFFDYEHLFEAYIPKEKRKLGYFALPVLINNRVVAALDLKTDRAKRELIIQKWTWLPKQKSLDTKRKIEEELENFEKFQLESEN